VVSALLLVLVMLTLTGIGVAAAVTQRRLDRERITLLLTFPADLASDATTSFYRSLAGSSQGLLARPSFVFETHARRGEISCSLAIPRSQQDAVTSNVDALLPGVVYAAAETGAITVVDALELKLNSRDRPLRTDNPAALISSVLASLLPLESGEELIISAVAAPAANRQQPRTGPDRPSTGPWWLRLATALVRPSSTNTDRVALARQKLSEPLFDGVLRIGVVAASAQRRRHLLRRVVAALQVLRLPGSQLQVRYLPPGVAARRLRARRTPLLPAITWNATELALTSVWPVAGVTAAGVRTLKSRRLRVPAGVPRTGRVLGDALVGEVRPVAQGDRDLSRHLLIQGATGVGKSTLIGNLLHYDFAAADRRAVVLIDGKGDGELLRDALTQVPEDRLDDVIVVDPTDPDVTVGANPLAEAGDRELVVERVFSVLRAIYSANWGPRLSDLLYAALVTIANAPGYTLAELPSLFTDAALRRRLVGRLGDELWAVRPIWAFYDGLSPSEQATISGPILNKMRSWTTRSRVRQFIGVERPLWSFDEVLREGRILLISLGSGSLGRETASLLGALLIDQLWSALTARGNADGGRHRPVSIVLDEWQRFVRLPIDLGEALAMARSYRAGLTLANQSPSQIPTELRLAALSQTRSKIVFEVGADDAPMLARSLGAPITADDLVHLERYQAVARLTVNNESTQPFSLRTRPLSPAISDPADVLRRSHARYGQSRDDVERAIRARLEPDVPDGPVGRRRRS
jgi:hypothetical protein